MITVIGNPFTSSLKCFSITIPTPATLELACLTILISPLTASPLAKKSSMIKTESSLLKNFYPHLFC